MHNFTARSVRATGDSGLVLRTPANMSRWPPNMLFHAVYASAVVKHFGAALEDIVQKWEGSFYPGGPAKAARAGDERRHGQANADEEKSQRQKIERQICHDKYSRGHGTADAIDFLDVVMMYRCSAMEPEDARAYVEGCEEMVAVRERKRLEEKVNSWRESLGVIGAD